MPLAGIAYLSGDEIWIEDHDIVVAPAEITAGPRVGIDYAGEDALLPYRFRLAAGQLSNR